MKRTWGIITIIIGLIFIITLSFADDKVVVIPMFNEERSSGDTTTVMFSGDSNTSLKKRYAGIAASASSSVGPNIYPMTRNGTINNFTLYIWENGLDSGASVQIAVEKNGVTTAISQTYSSTTSLGVKTISGTVSFNAGDRIAIFALDSGVTLDDMNYTGAFDIEY
jgi:hypothetical protein